MTSKYKWQDPKHFFSCDVGVIVDHDRNEHDDDDGYITVTESMKRRIDGDDYEVTTSRQWGVEGESYQEDWTKNGELHRMGRMPARLWVDEGPCAEDSDGNNRREKQVFCVHGQTIKTVEKASRMGEPQPEPEGEELTL